MAYIGGFRFDWFLHRNAEDIGEKFAEPLVFDHAAVHAKLFECDARIRLHRVDELARLIRD